MAPPDQPAANDRCRGLSVAVFHDDIAGVSALPREYKLPRDRW